MHRLHLLSLIAAILFSPSISASNACTSFAINSSTSTATSTFSRYRFYDFRNLVPGSIANAQTFTNLSDLSTSNGLDFAILRSTNDTSWIQDWRFRTGKKETGNRGITALSFEPANVYIGGKNTSSTPYTHLSFHTTISPESPSTQSVSELDFSSRSILYLSLRISLRVSGSPGAVAGIFTYLNDSAESDIEILTRDPLNYVHFSNQAASPSAEIWSVNTTLGASGPGTGEGKGWQNDDWGEWNDYRIDWLPGLSRWWINGAVRAETTTNVPRVPSAVILDMWGNGGAWSGRMGDGEVAEMHVRWVEMVFNVSDAASESSAHVSKAEEDKQEGWKWKWHGLLVDGLEKLFDRGGERLEARDANGGAAAVVCNVEKALGNPMPSKGGKCRVDQGVLWGCFLVFLLNITV